MDSQVKSEPDKRPGDVQDNVKAGNGRVTGVKSYKFTKSFLKITWEIKWKASCKHHGIQAQRKVKYFEETKSNVNTL